MLFLIIGTSLTITCSFHGLLENYNLNCISHTKLNFVNQITNTSDCVWPSQKLDQLEYYSQLLLLHFNKTLTNELENERKAGINKLRRVKEISSEIKEENLKRQLVYNDDDINFFQTSKLMCVCMCMYKKNFFINI